MEASQSYCEECLSQSQFWDYESLVIHYVQLNKLRCASSLWIFEGKQVFVTSIHRADQKPRCVTAPLIDNVIMRNHRKQVVIAVGKGKASSNPTGVGERFSQTITWQAATLHRCELPLWAKFWTTSVLSLYVSIYLMLLRGYEYFWASVCREDCLYNYGVITVQTGICGAATHVRYWWI